GGTVIGCGVVSYFVAGVRVTPISPLGFFVGSGGAFVMLLFYRLLGGRFSHEGEHAAADSRIRLQRRRPRSRRPQLVEEDCSRWAMIPPCSPCAGPLRRHARCMVHLPAAASARFPP